MKRNVFAWLLTLLLCVATVGLAETQPTAITLRTAEVNVRAGGMVQIDLRVTPHAARSEGVSYQSDNEAVATVDAKGRVRGVAVGECAVTVTSRYDPAVTARVPVRVIVPVAKLSLGTGEARVYAGGTLQLSVGYEPQNATLQSVTYTSSRESVATVSATGLVTGVKRGAADIVVTSADGHAKARRRIVVLQPVADISISAKTTTLAVGQMLELKATVMPSDANNKTVLWYSSDEEIATVNEHGRVAYLAPGEVIITAVCQENPAVSASITLADERLAESVEFEGTELILNVGQSVTPGYTVLPADTTDPSVTYEMSHPNVARVNAQGEVAGLKAGRTTLYIYTADGSRQRDHMLVTVCQPVRGVAMERAEVRVGVGNYTRQKAVLQPSDATDNAMTWASSDESVATVNGTGNEVTIHAHRWGDCVVTGTTADGGHTASITVHGGSYNRTIRVASVSIQEGKPYLMLENASNLAIACVNFEMRGYDERDNPIALSTRGPDFTLLTGSYEEPLLEGERTRHGRFAFAAPAEYANLHRLEVTVVGFRTEDGFEYAIPREKQKTAQYFSDLYLQQHNKP